jgi:hypothetical protein
VGNYQSANMPIEAFLIFFDQGGKGGFSGGGHSKAKQDFVIGLIGHQGLP